MKQIKLSKELVSYFHQSFFWQFGGEGIICKIPNKGKQIVLKLFYNPFEEKFYLSDEIMENKQKKLELLGKRKLPNEIQVLASANLHNQFIGYFMNLPNDFEDFNQNVYFSNYQKLVFLKKRRNQLKRFHDLGIIFGDIKDDNILSHYKNYQVGCFCDLDNVKIDQFSIDTFTECMDDFLFSYGKLDEKLDWYMFNLLTLETIFHLDLATEYIYDETLSFINHYNGKNEIIKEMRKISNHYSGNLLIDDPNFYEEIKVPYCIKKN